MILAGRTKLKVSKNFFRGISFCICCNRSRSPTKIFLQPQSHKNFFQVISKQKKNGLEKIFQPIYKILTIQKIVLSSSRKQGNFRGPEASRPRPRTSKCVLEAKDVFKDSTFKNYSSILAIVNHRNWLDDSQSLIRRNIAPGLCDTAVGCQQFRKESRKRQRRIMFERNYSFFHHCVLFCQ